jgi:NitT/TauT family transport system substrate-binding protein
MKKLLGAAAIVGTLALAGCSAPAATTAPRADGAAEDHGSLTIAMVASACLPLFPTYVAQEQGYFAENGIDVTIQPVSGSAAVLQAMLSDQAQIGTPGATPLIFSAAEGAEVSYFANTMPGGSFSLITTADTGIEDAAGLEGATIGVSTADGGEVAFLKSVLAENGLEEGDYEILVVGEGGQAVAGFARGDIDAFAAAPDGVATLSTAGLDILDISGTSAAHMFGNGLAATNELIAERPEAVQAFWNAYRDAAEYGKENPEAVLETCKKYQPQEVEDPAFAEAMLKAFEKSQTSIDGSAYGTNSLEQWERIISDLVAAGELEEGAVDVEALFTNEFVDASGR